MDSYSEFYCFQNRFSCYNLTKTIYVYQDLLTQNSIQSGNAIYFTRFRNIKYKHTIFRKRRNMRNTIILLVTMILTLQAELIFPRTAAPAPETPTPIPAASLPTNPETPASPQPSSPEPPGPTAPPALPLQSPPTEPPAASAPDLLPTMCRPPALNLKQPFSETTQTLPGVPSPTAGQPVQQLRRRYSIRGNLIKSMFDRSYRDADGRQLVFQRYVVSERVNKTVPESEELPQNNEDIVPYYGAIADPDTFTDWKNFSEAVYRQLNLARTQPALYANFIFQQLNTFQEDGFTYRQGGKPTMSEEGKAAWLQAIAFLQTQQPMPALRRVSCLDCSAQYMVEDSSNNSLIAHIDSQGRTNADRTEIACLNSPGGENIAYGMLSARAAIVQLIVDDGVPDRGHRTNIFRHYTQVGIASGKYQLEYGTITVHDFLY